MKANPKRPSVEERIRKRGWGGVNYTGDTRQRPDETVGLGSSGKQEPVRRQSPRKVGAGGLRGSGRESLGGGGRAEAEGPGIRRRGTRDWQGEPKDFALL